MLRQKDYKENILLKKTKNLNLKHITLLFKTNTCLIKISLYNIKLVTKQSNGFKKQQLLLNFFKFFI